MVVLIKNSWLEFIEKIRFIRESDICYRIYLAVSICKSHGSFELSHKENKKEKAICKLGLVMIGSFECD